MLKENDYESYLDELGITKEEDRATIVNYIRALFALAIETLQATAEPCYD